MPCCCGLLCCVGVSNSEVKDGFGCGCARTIKMPRPSHTTLKMWLVRKWPFEAFHSSYELQTSPPVTLDSVSTPRIFLFPDNHQLGSMSFYLSPQTSMASRSSARHSARRQVQQCFPSNSGGLKSFCFHHLPISQHHEGRLRYINTIVPMMNLCFVVQ